MIASLSSRALWGIHPVTKSLYWKHRHELFHCQQCLNAVYVRFVNKTRMSKISLLLFGLLRKNMTFIRMFPLDFSCSGKGEPLFGTGISLHFWHFAVLEFVNIIFYVSPRSGEKVCKSNDFIRTIKTLPVYFLPGEVHIAREQSSFQ